jgi:DNA-binding XRE family transcriptional regulator
MYMGRKPKTQEEQIFNHLEAARQKAGLSRQELADLVEVHYQTIGYIERDEYSPSLVLALKIAKELKQPLENIFTITKGSTK